MEISKNSTRFRIARMIGEFVSHGNDLSYEQLLENIYDNSYRTIYKVPTQEFILGIVESFIIKDEEHANKILKIVQEVVQEALEISGFELTFRDEDWHNLKISEDTSYWKKEKPWKLNTRKAYMSEFFEL